jgi:hypothetical protein
MTTLTLQVTEVRFDFDDLDFTPEEQQAVLDDVMTLNKAQFQQLIDNYANHIIEGLDNDSMEIMLFDLITAEYADYTEEQIVNEITEIYGEEFAHRFVRISN